jgi:hypothetical protein
MALGSLSAALTPNPFLAMIPIGDLYRLHGKLVLVRFARSERDLPIALRGSLEVRRPEPPDRTPLVDLILVFSDMFNVSAYSRVITLAEDALHQILASERNGTFEFTIENDLVLAGN